MTDSSPAPTADTHARNEKAERWLRIVPWLILAAVLLAIMAVTTHWERWESDDVIQTTDDATIQTDGTVLQAKIGGYVRTVAFPDFGEVKAGQLLVEIDDRDYRAAVAQAEAALAKAEAMLEAHRFEIAAQQSKLSQARALAAVGQNRLALALADERRIVSLDGSEAVTGQETDRARATASELRATRDAEVAAIGIEQGQLGSINGRRAQLQADVMAARAELDAARIALSHAHIVAPTDGSVGQRLVQKGSLLSAGSAVVNFVPRTPAFVVANYKETQLARIMPGQPVDVLVDGFPGEVLKGRVASLAPSGGSAFSPARQSGPMGNFTKVVQRIPVRIDLLPGQPLARRVRAGMSVTTRIDTHG